ncbi:OLC1v1028864C1 [Oldenlandia corymbosa var. corymbosa]|uniref:OLC1v1028864C1 n=1 Tax=Oldenlandia corymbosa var. corymbosa TaxID=529605 RepID=A0AAV1CCQ3_OLDCO|nr:OLC1v1028864C1 [Oldenlandia corymbosa var. corymbosa]
MNSSLSDRAGCSGSSCSSSRVADFAFAYDFWTQKPPDSIIRRRTSFLKWMGLDLEWYKGDREEVNDGVGIGRLDYNSDSVLANSDYEEGYFSAQSFRSDNDQTDETKGSSVEYGAAGEEEETQLWKIRNLDDGTEYVADELNNDGMLSYLREVGTNKTLSFEEFQRYLGTSASVQKFFRRDSNFKVVKKKVKKGWFQKLSDITTCHLKSSKVDSFKNGDGPRIVRSHSHGKRLKELSLLQAGQEFSAHKGSILSMKFSHDGQYMASAGQDGVVRVWKVIEDDYPNRIDNIEDTESSCIYLSIDQFSKLAPLDSEKMIAQVRDLKKSSESTCAVLPPKVFRLLERPIHEFHGHSGDVLALSWSKNGYLLSSSVDKTARLWQVGNDKCLGVYAHNNYVTCLDFNPADDDYFISGSIDGKLRIWKVHDFRVVDWTDMREIVTAVCYSPDGKGGIVGSMDGNCRFYDVVDNRMQLGAQICLQGKKKSGGKRITGFQFCPDDVNKVMVSSADSQVRILSGANIICKFKGMKCSGSQVSASFTSDGKHVMSITEDSNVYIWDYANQNLTSKSVKSISAHECFFSPNASVTISWGGLKNKAAGGGPILEHGPFDQQEDSVPKSHSALPDCLSLGRGLFLDVLSKASATWPEEKLLDTSQLAAAVSPLTSRPEFKFLKSALSSSHLWGLVVVTAGWDGCIKTFLNHGLPIRF